MPKQSKLIPWLKSALKNHGDSDECLEWPYSRNLGGYGVVAFNMGRPIPVHRVAFFLTYGRWPTPCGLHKCDNRVCFNPQHIFEGTLADNNADTLRKGRSKLLRASPPGAENPNAKLTEAQVAQIRAEYIPGKVGVRRLAKKFGVGPHAIHAIVRRESWKKLS